MVKFAEDIKSKLKNHYHFSVILNAFSSTIFLSLQFAIMSVGEL